MNHRNILAVEDMCRLLRPIFGDKMDQLYMKYSLLDTKEAQLEIEQALKTLYQKHLSPSLLSEELLLEPPKKGTVSGDYPLGTIMYGKHTFGTFGLREKDWMRHMLVSGMSGSGKTNFAFQILGNFIFKEKPFLVFDWKKSFRPLIKLNENLRLYTVGRAGKASFKLNINKPPVGVHPKEWIGLLADLITESYNASFGVHKLLVDTLDQAYLEFGVYAGSNNYPTWEQIRDRLEDKAERHTKKGRESEWLESAMRIAHALTFGSFGESICYKKYDAATIEDLITKQTIFELASLTNTEKKFFCQFILTYIYKYAKAGNVNTTEDFKYAILVDEAHNIFLKDRPTFISESIPDVIFREIREYGVSLITLDQHISKLSDVVAGNSATNIAFQQMLPPDIEAVSRLDQLYEKKNYFTKLPVGQAIVKMVERHNDPFVIAAPLITLKGEDISDARIEEHMKKLVKDDVRKAEFERRCSEERLAKEVKKLTDITMISGVEPREEDIIAQLQQAQSRYEQEEQDKGKSPGITNHVQQKILDETRKRMLNGEELEHIKRWWINEGTKRSDIQQVFTYIKRKGIAQRLGVKTEKKPLVLNEEQKALLETAMAYPEKSVTQVYLAAGLSMRKGNDLKKQLEDADIISIDERKNEKGWSKHITINFNHDLTEQLHSHTT